MIQMLVAARFRSVENRTTLVRGTNGGITCVIGWHGEVLSMLEPFHPDWLHAKVPVYSDAGQTPYSLYGDVFPAFAGALLIVALLLAYRKRSPTST